MRMDFKKALPILTQLDYWTLLVDLLDVHNLAEQEERETRQGLIKVK